MNGGALVVVLVVVVVPALRLFKVVAAIFATSLEPYPKVFDMPSTVLRTNLDRTLSVL